MATKTGVAQSELNQLLDQAVRALRRGYTRRAITQLRGLLRHHVNRALIYYNLGIAWERLKRYRQALVCYRRALRADPTLIDAAVSQGIVYGLQGNFQRELRCYNEALKRSPRNSIAVYNKGVVLDDHLGNTREAVRWYLRALRTRLSRQQAKDVYLRLCHACLELRQFRHAEKYLKRLMVL